MNRICIFVFVNIRLQLWLPSLRHCDATPLWTIWHRLLVPFFKIRRKSVRCSLISTAWILLTSRYIQFKMLHKFPASNFHCLWIILVNYILLCLTFDFFASFISVFEWFNFLWNAGAGFVGLSVRWRGGTPARVGHETDVTAAEFIGAMGRMVGKRR